MGAINVTDEVNKVGLEGAREYLRDMRKAKGDGAFTDVELEEMLLKAFQMGVMTALEMQAGLAKYGGKIVLEREKKGG
jgi:hypothetical protein